MLRFGWTLDKPNGFLVHLPSRVKSLGGNLVKSYPHIAQCILGRVHLFCGKESRDQEIISLTLFSALKPDFFLI